MSTKRHDAKRRGFPTGAISVLAIVLSSGSWTSMSIAGPHPLDPLSSREISETVGVIAATGDVDRTTRAAIITLKQPNKADVLRWREGERVSRKAFAVLRVKGKTIETVVDLATKTLESWSVIENAQPPILSSELARAQALVKQDARWRDAMRARGYQNFDDLFCDSLSAGYFGSAEEQGRRLLKMPCYDVSGARTNIYARPIEGVITTVDLDAGSVVRVEDEGVVPVGERLHEFGDQAARGLSPSPDHVVSPPPDDWALRLDGRIVSWRDWSFHLGFDQRFGPMLSLVRHHQGGEARSVLYQAHVSEIFVPYMEPSPAWSFRTYMDAGEYGLGTLSSSLRPGIDCPRNAVYWDATLATPSGRARRRHSVICIFERNRDEPLWRHSEAFNKAYAGRPARELIVRSIPAIAHYDYVIDWVFQQSGTIEIRIGATGIDAVKAATVASMSEPGAAENAMHGSLVAPGLLAISHDHYFSIRLDFDIDGPVNRFARQRLARVTLPRDNPRRSIWRLQDDPMRIEGAVPNGRGPQVWRIENPSVTTKLGHHPSYQIQGQGPTSLLAPSDWPQRRAAFSASNLWITARREGELHAAGPYPNQSLGGEGLPSYANGESIEETDLVAWYTMGFHHVTRPEDWPVLSTVWRTVTLRPFGFFTRNPSLDISARPRRDPR